MLASGYNIHYKLLLKHIWALLKNDFINTKRLKAVVQLEMISWRFSTPLLLFTIFANFLSNSFFHFYVFKPVGFLKETTRRIVGYAYIDVEDNAVFLQLGYINVAYSIKTSIYLE